MQKPVTRPPPLSVLIVDRDPEMRQMYSELLTYSGLRVLECASAADAFESAQRLRPDVITTGIRLDGDTDGCALCERLKQDPQTRSIPVIALTAWALGGHVERARLAGCDAVLIKPCLPEVLLAEIHKLLHRRPSPHRGSD